MAPFLFRVRDVHAPFIHEHYEPLVALSHPSVTPEKTGGHTHSTALG